MTSRTGLRGFTLIEVLLATFVIALGVLGLLALFAGAARQQQDSAQSTSAAFAANGAQGALLQSIGELTLPTGVLPNGVWLRNTIYSEDFPYMTTPTGTYVLAPPTQALPRDLYTLEDPGGTYAVPSIGIPPVAGFVDQPIAPYDNVSHNYFFRDRRVDPASIGIQVSYSLAYDPDMDGTPDPAWSEFTRNFERTLGVTYVSDGASQASGQWVVPLDGDINHDPMNTASLIPAADRNYLIVDTQPALNGTDFARLYAVNFGFIGNPSPEYSSGHVTAITLLNYTWENDQLVSLDDRLKTRPDPSGFQGRVAEQCYSLLFRRRPGNLTDVTLMAYQLTPTTSGAQFIPPERPADIVPAANRGPIRQVNMVLHRDADDPTKQYFRLDDGTGSPLWAIQPGQKLLIAEGVGLVGGADDTVEVVRLVRETTDQGNQWRGYISAMPRVFDPNIAAPNPPYRAAVPVGAASDGPYVVFGVADSVVSLAADRSTWKLTPLFSRTFEVRFQN